MCLKYGLIASLCKPLPKSLVKKSSLPVKTDSLIPYPTAPAPINSFKPRPSPFGAPLPNLFAKSPSCWAMLEMWSRRLSLVCKIEVWDTVWRNHCIAKKFGAKNLWKKIFGAENKAENCSICPHISIFAHRSGLFHSSFWITCIFHSKLFITNC